MYAAYSTMVSSCIVRKLFQSGNVQFSTAVPVGLFGMQRLVSPQAWMKLAQEAVDRCDGLSQSVRLATQPCDAVQYMDDMSDVLCQVYDAAEFCRNVHADPAWREGAQQAILYLGGYIQTLNTDVGLYSALVRALQTSVTPGVAPLSPEAHLVATLLRRDFEKSGIHLPEAQRLQLTNVTMANQMTGMRIGQNLVDPDALGDVELSVQELTSLQLLPSSVRGRAQKRGGGRVLADNTVAHSVLRWVGDDDLRRKMFVAMNTSPAANVPLFEELIAQRQEMAHLLGQRSYAQYKADFATLAETPQAVMAFLENLADALKPKAHEEMRLLHKAKRQILRSDAPVTAWDRLYLMEAVKAQVGDSGSGAVAQYLQLENCIAGLGKLLEHVMGVQLVELEFEPGERWADDISKMALIHADEGLLGHIYLDLHPRPGKFPAAAHFMLRCGRAQSNGVYQRPLVALVCNFPAGRGALLSHSELETLFHEFGHALNSLLSRTHFQHLSGTRGSLDVVELPAHLMEHFVTDHRCLSLFARHHVTGEVVPQGLVNNIAATKRLFSALDTEQQVLLSLIDQRLHSCEAALGPGDVTSIARSLVERYSSFPLVEGTYPHIRFTHLVGYGGSYYAYLYATCLAEATWDKHFADDPLNREAGETVRRLLFEPGGAQIPRDLMTSLLGSDVLRNVQGGWAPDCSKLLSSLGGG